MTAKLEFDPIAANDSRWFEKLCQRAKQINELKQKEGRSFWILSTFGGKEHRVSLYEAEGATLYLSVRSMSDKFGIRKIKSLIKDSKSEDEWEAISGTAEKEAFYKEWASGGDYWGPSL